MENTFDTQQIKKSREKVLFNVGNPPEMGNSRLQKVEPGNLLVVSGSDAA